MTHTYAADLPAFSCAFHTDIVFVAAGINVYTLIGQRHFFTNRTVRRFAVWWSGYFTLKQMHFIGVGKLLEGIDRHVSSCLFLIKNLLAIRKLLTGSLSL
jgi:hypothetical protein